MEQEILYSMIVVCLNPGEELSKTITSILQQTEKRFEIIIKDGFSTDGSLERLPKDERIHIYQEKDHGIYDAMNQAIQHAVGNYFIFMNCGDYFYQSTVLEQVTKKCKTDNKNKTITPDIIYGNLYNRKLDTVIYASPSMNAFACYRNVPCHQTCFYQKALFAERGYETRYTVRADYEHFLWCYFVKKAKMQYIDLIIANYEGGGFSETRENLKKSDRQHKEIVEKYMGKKKALQYRIMLFLSFAPLRKKMAESEHFSQLYNKVKTTIYRLKK